MIEVGIYKGVIITEKKAFTDRIWYEFVFSNSNRDNEKRARGCYWMIRMKIVKGVISIKQYPVVERHAFQDFIFRAVCARKESSYFGDWKHLGCYWMILE